MNSHPLLVGVNHATAPLSVRERLAQVATVLANDWGQIIGSSSDLSPALSEYAVLSTCNRLEIYAVARDVPRARTAIMTLIAEQADLSDLLLSGVCYTKSGRDAALHLARVAGGLDSLVLGESEILGQVAATYRSVCQQRGIVLRALFQHALRAGRRARAETSIGRNATSVPSAAVTLADQVMGGVSGRVALVVGAGAMATSAASILAARGVRVTVANRTQDHAQRLATRVGGAALPFAELERGLACADLVITATSAPGVVLARHHLAGATAARDERPLFIFDLAVPRDVEPAAAALPYVRLFDVDALREVVEDNLVARQAAAGSVEEIAGAEADAFIAWLRTRSVTPTITELRRRAEAVKERQIDRTLRRLGPVTEDQRAALDALADGIINALLHDPTVRLKQRAMLDDGPLYDEMVRGVFGLSGHGGRHA